MSHLLIRHKVADFAKWKESYDRHIEARQSAGLTEQHLWRSITDPNEVVLLFAADDLDKAETLTESDDLRTEMQSAGVIDKPDIYFLR